MSDKLQQVLTSCGNSIGKAMSIFRKQLDNARRDGDDRAAAVAELLYIRAAEIQHKRNQIVIADIMDSQEIQDLITSLTSVNKALKRQIEDVNAVTKEVGKVKQVFGQLEAIFSQFLSPIRLPTPKPTASG